MSRLTELKTRAQQHVDTARNIAATADREKRSMTDAEKATYDDALAKGREVLEQIKVAKSDLEVLEQVNALATGIGGPGTAVPQLKAPAWADAVAKKMAATATAQGVKALVSGDIDIPSPIAAGIVEFPDNPTRLIDVLINRERVNGNEYDFLRQTVRTNNAAPVPDFGTKPTSIFTFQEISDRVRVIAHLSEPVPERYFADHGALINILQSEMYRGVLDALEREAVQGDGTGEHLTGILNTSGTVAQAFTTDVMTTLRKARTGFQTREEVPTAWAFNPADVESFDLLQDADERYQGELTNIFGNLPRIVSTSVPAGQAILADWNQAKVFVREDSTLAADRSGVNFTKNQVVLRQEGRYGFGVLRPRAFTIVDLTA